MISQKDPGAQDRVSESGEEAHPVPPRTALGLRIIAAAGEILDETGSESSVTLRAIARRAGVSAPAIYGHFPNVPSILLAVVQNAFAELDDALEIAVRSFDERTSAPTRLRAIAAAYLAFAESRPQRYRLMFGGLWTATQAIESSAVTRADVESLGQATLLRLAMAVQECVDVGASSSTEPSTDAVALWLGLHGLAHQRLVTAAFPWPRDIEERLVTALAHLD